MNCASACLWIIAGAMFVLLNLLILNWLLARSAAPA
jgi:hypothetical protein